MQQIFYIEGLKMKIRIIRELKKHIFIYYLWVSFTNLYIPCVFRVITGLKCPGCGITHMIMAACRFDFKSAFSENPLLFVTLPIVGIIYAVKKCYYIKTGTKIKDGKAMRVLEYILLALFIIFGIVRNILPI